MEAILISLIGIRLGPDDFESSRFSIISIISWGLVGEIRRELTDLGPRYMDEPLGFKQVGIVLSSSGPMFVKKSLNVSTISFWSVILLPL